MPTLIKHAIRTASEWAANQTAMEAIYGVDGYYTTISLWVDDFPASFITEDEYWLAEPYADWPAGLADIINFPGRSADPTRTAEITPLESERHIGIIGTGFYIKAQRDFGYVFDIDSIQHVKISYLSIENTSSSFQQGVSGSIAGKVDNCIFKSGGTTYRALTLSITKDTLIISNNNAISISTNCELYNTTVLGNLSGTAFGGSMDYANKLVNCISYNDITDFFGLVHAESSNNATSHPTLNSDLGTIVNVDVNDFIDAANEDAHLSPTSVLIGEGLNLITSGDLSSPQYDFEDDQWPDSGVWDIGADYYVVAGPSNPIANNDSYDVTGGQLIVPPSGILTNDDYVCS